MWAGINSNSTPVSTPLGNNPLLPHGACLTAPDLDRIRAFIHDMCAHALLPHIEKQIQQLSDQVRLILCTFIFNMVPECVFGFVTHTFLSSL